MTPPGRDLDDEEVSLRPHLETLWRYRQVIAAATAAAAVMFGVTTLAVLALAPPDRIASLEFRLTFTDANKGRYPNGNPFNPTDITAKSIVSEVFAANQLGRYTSPEKLQQSLSVDKSSPAVRQLDAEFQAQLSRSRAVDDRLRLEAAYRARRDAIQEPQFELRLHRNGGLRDIPEPVIESLLSDTLETWAMRADVMGGVSRPDIDPVSPAMFERAADKNESYFARIDVMRSGAQRMLASLNALQQIPGARAVRSADNRSIADEVAAVQELTTVDLETLAGMIRVAPVSPRERMVLDAYLSGQIATARLSRDSAATRVRTLQTVLREYMAQRDDRVDLRAPAGQPGAGAAGPGLSESFVKEMVTLGAAAQDREFEYRRALSEALVAASADEAAATRQVSYYQHYQDLLNHLSAPASAALSSALLARFTATYERLLETAERVAALSQAVSTEILNPTGRLYSVTAPVRLQTAPSVSTELLAIRFALTVIVTFIVACIASLIHASRPRATAAPASQPSLEART